MNPWVYVGWYLLVGVTIYVFVPKPPKAKEAFDMAERLHPAWGFLTFVLCSVIWPLLIPGYIMRWWRR